MRPRSCCAAALCCMALASAAGQPPPALRWDNLPGPSGEGTAWMDSTHIATKSDGFPEAWYKIRAPGETKYTIVHYAVDCTHFSLSARRQTVYDSAGTVLDDRRSPTGFYPPPFVHSLQLFMHVVCGRTADFRR